MRSSRLTIAHAGDAPPASALELRMRRQLAELERDVRRLRSEFAELQWWRLWERSSVARQLELSQSRRDVLHELLTVEDVRDLTHDRRSP